MTKKIIFMGLSALTITLAGCSWTDRQIGPNDYEISGYFDFTMKGEVVVKGLEDQARLYCKGVGQNLVPQVYYIPAKGADWQKPVSRVRIPPSPPFLFFSAGGAS